MSHICGKITANANPALVVAATGRQFSALPTRSHPVFKAVALVWG